MSFLSLKIFKQDQLVKTKIFTDDQISVGSSEGLNLQLDGISPWHILIEKKHDIFCILDLNSETGTLLNGQKITEETPISSGSLITVGPYEIQFFIGPPVEKQAQTPIKAKPKAVHSPSIQGEQDKPVQTPVETKLEAPVFDSPSIQGEQDKPVQTPVETKLEVPAFDAPSVQEEQEKPVQTPSMESSIKEKAAVSQDITAPPVSGSLPEDSPVVQRASKPSQKGFWSTYAPLSKIQNLDEFLDPSIGNLIEVIVCWKERILRTYHFFEGGDIFMGSEKTCQVKFPNMLNQASYKLLTVAAGAKVFLSHGVRGLLFQGRDKSTRTSHKLQGDQTVILKPYEMVKLEFNSSLKVYVRLMDKTSKAPFVGLLNLKLSEAMALFLAFLLTGLLVFYGSLYAPAFLAKDEEFIEKDVRIAKVIFKKASKPEPAKVVKLDVKDTIKKSKVKKRKSKVKKKKKSVTAIKRPKPKPKKIVKKFKAPKKGKTGKMVAQAPGKKPIKKKVTVGSVRPGGSIKTGKKGSSAKTVAPDPTKMGLLGVFGGGGKLKQLDKGASGSGGLLGLAEKSTGFAGTEEAYEGEGIGTKTKDLGSGGQGSSLVGISGIKTKGKGLGVSGRGSGGLGKRGRMNIEFASEDIEVSGEIDRGAILGVLKRNQSKFQSCYQTSLNQNPSAQGNLGMQWLISAKGRGQKAKAVSDPIGSSYLTNCVARVLERLNFPSPPSGQIPQVTFTFRFYL